MFITDKFYVLTTTILLHSGDKLFTCNLFHIAIYNADRDSGDRPGSRYTREAQYIQHEREIQNSTRRWGDCTQEAKNETTVTLAEAKNYFSDFFTDVEY